MRRDVLQSHSVNETRPSLKLSKFITESDIQNLVHEGWLNDILLFSATQFFVQRLLEVTASISVREIGDVKANKIYILFLIAARVVYE